MSYLDESLPVKKVENVVKMNGTQTPLVKEVDLFCKRCPVLYKDYKHLLEHLYWRHGTESFWCKSCGLKRWHFAPHVCHALPVNDSDFDEYSQYCVNVRESEFCYCGRHVDDSPMIGCDGPECLLQWYHFECVGIVTAPEGDWLCPKCAHTNSKTMSKKGDQHVKI